MPEPFKNLLNPKVISLMARHLNRVWKNFDEEAFIKEACLNLERLELKQRGDQIKGALHSQLPKSFSKAATILVESLHPEDDVDLSGTNIDDQGIRGWAIMPMAEFVGAYGLNEFELGMDTLKQLTKRASSEFGIRPFIHHDPGRALKILTNWTGDTNFHVRRLVSEGTRPRLPWGSRLQMFVENPAPLLPLLERLKDDPHEYVRRSVANNLNDIAKDHPGLVVEIAGKWLKKATPERQRLVRHACRTLIKQGHSAALSALGYEKPKVTLRELRVLTPGVDFGDVLRFSIDLQSTAASNQDLIIDYAVHHCKANGKTAPKVFKWKVLSLKAGERLMAERKHSIKSVTTRTYYPGTHRVEIMVNGKSLGSASFELKMV